MKYLVFFTLTCFLLSNCQSNTTQDERIKSVSISGEILNADDQLVKVLIDDEVADIEMSEGKFDYEFESNAPKMVTIWHGPHVARLYTEPGSDIQLNVDASNQEASFDIQGSFKTENDFWSSRKEKFPTPPYQEHYAQSEEDFLLAVRKRKDEMSEGLNEANKDNSLSKEFIQMAKIDFDYELANDINQYGSYHGYVTEQPDYKPSELITDAVKEFKLDEPNNLLSPSYKRFVYGSISEKSWDKIKDSDGELSMSTESIKLLDEYIKSPNVKDYVFYKIIDDMFIDGLQPEDDVVFERFKKESINPAYLAVVEEKYNKWSKLKVGEQAPDFSYVDIDGKEIGLKDLKGKVVYVDVWATWCGPCRAEHPALHDLEKQYESNDKVAFVGVSIDEDKEAWRKMVTDNKMGGTQLISDKAWDSAIAKEYLIEGIPRFIMIDQEGKIMNASAPRPSSGKVQDIIDTQLKVNVKEA